MMNPLDLTRREFIRQTCLAPLAVQAGGAAPAASPAAAEAAALPGGLAGAPADVPANMLGAYGPWAASLVGEALPAFSFRQPAWPDLETWRPAARQRLMERLARPARPGVPEVTVHRESEYEGLHVEELSWQLPYGPPTEAILLKPAGSRGRLPAVLGLHDHGGNKYFGTRKITRTAGAQHPMMVAHQARYYGGAAWANELARRGYVVLVPDAFAFASRRVRPEDVPEAIRYGVPVAVEDPEQEAYIEAYNRWAGEHESIMARSLFSAGTTWPGVWLGEDQGALDVLCARADVDEGRVGCGGLSGGGLRTVFLSGVDERIRCAACVGMMTTWRDYVLHKSHTHTWMIYVPLLPNELDYPEIMGLRVPLPTLVLNNVEDPLFTEPEMRRADAILGAVYAKAGAADRYRCDYFPGGHKFDRAMQAAAFAWFDRWLKAG